MQRARRFAAMSGIAGAFLATLVGVGNGEENLGLAKPGESLRLSLLRTPQVQKELKITEDQQKKIGRIEEQSKAAKQQVESEHGKGKDSEKGKAKTKLEDPVAKEEERAAREAMEGDLHGVERQSDRQLDSVLDTKQRTRLTQIVLRIQGPSAFLTPELIETLRLGPDQFEMIQAILSGMKVEQEQYKESRKRAFDRTKGSGDIDFEKIRKEQQKGQLRAYADRLGKQVMPQIGKVLTKRQRDQYNQMLGDPFELTRLTGPDGLPLLDPATDLAASLIRQQVVRDELKLTLEQKARLDKDEPWEKVLDSAQRSRLHQLVLQGEGPAAITNPEVVRALRLDEDRLDQIEAVLDDLLGAHRQFHDTLKSAKRDFGGDDPKGETTRKEQEKAQLRAGSADLRRQAMKRINAILTPKQRDTFARLIGAPFDFAKVHPQRPEGTRELENGRNTPGVDGGISPDLGSIDAKRP